ncbi:MAG TPA: response regulator transcription factor [Bacteroidales bacterium]|nr:response regulator transcription factor [Bacteroidales bacterium]
MKYIAVDDEPMALDIMTDYALKLDFLECSGTFRDAVSAVSFLNRNDVDLILLDINMPEISGLQMLETLRHPPLVIITTAYSDYALEGYRFDVVDYLLKPVEFERFLKAVNKAYDLFCLHNNAKRTAGNKEKMVAAESTRDHDEYWVKSGTEFIRLQLSDILYIKSDSNYVEYHLKDKKVLVLDSLSSLSRTLPVSLFVRTHKSYIAGIRHIKSFERHQLLVGDKTIPVGQSYRQGLLKMAKKKEEE